MSVKAYSVGLKPHIVFQALFGIVLLAFVAMGVFGWQPPPVLPEAEPFRDAILGSGYVIPAILLVYFLTGISFLTNRFVPLGAVVLFPVSLNILLFHLTLNPGLRSIGMASALFLANAYMLYRSRAAYGPLFHAKS
jgi:putative oxidoreductase